LKDEGRYIVQSASPELQILDFN